MNNNVFQHFQGYELLIKTLDEGVRRYKRNGIPSVYGFVGLDVCNIVTRYLGNEVEYMLYGGYDKAFSKFLVIGDDIDPHDYMTCLKAPFNPAYIHSNIVQVGHTIIYVEQIEPIVMVVRIKL